MAAASNSQKNVKKTTGKSSATTKKKKAAGTTKKETAVKKTAPSKELSAKPAKTIKKNSGPANTWQLTEFDIFLFRQGKHYRLYDKLGAHPAVIDGVSGTHFAVWAPNAERIFVAGDFNEWNREQYPMTLRGDQSGIWECFIPAAAKGHKYKFFLHSKFNLYKADKGDPYAFFWEQAPGNSSIIWDLDYTWHDKKWMKKRHEHNALDKPWSIYEMHLGSWRRSPEEGNRSLTYRELAPLLVEHLTNMGFTHVEFMPVMEHPLYRSWGYQTTGYFAPTSRYGSPQDFMYLIDYLHQHDIGVILDWVPSHFPGDEHGLAYFDGTHLYEHADERQGFHPDWKSWIFNYGRHEVTEFLLSSALFWLDKYHVDGFRLDAVASMLYLDYSRKEGEWIPNKDGGRENIEAIEFLKNFNATVYSNFPDVQTIAEESTAWEKVSRPTYVGGLGFGLKWNMGWMHDSLAYFKRDPIYRTHHHDQLTFSMLYAFNENFVLPFSHDEVVHGKGSLLGRMPGDEWQRFANLRLLLGYQWAHPGKKLLFMGGEFGQFNEWWEETSCDWHLTKYPHHEGICKWVGDLNALYKKSPPLFERDFDWWGFEWVSCEDRGQSILAFIRRANSENDVFLVVANFTPVPRYNYRVGVPIDCKWKEVLNSDARYYGGSGLGNMGEVQSYWEPMHKQPCSVNLTLPPLSIVMFQPAV